MRRKAIKPENKKIVPGQRHGWMITPCQKDGPATNGRREFYYGAQRRLSERPSGKNKGVTRLCGWSWKWIRPMIQPPSKALLDCLADEPAALMTYFKDPG